MAERRSTWLQGVRATYLYPLTAPLVTLVVIGLGLEASWLVRLENVFVDSRFKWRSHEDPPADPRIHVIEIEEKDLLVFGRWPWTRTVHRDLLTLLGSKSPEVVTFDLLFTEREGHDNSVDQEFGDAAARLGIVVTGAIRNFGTFDFDAQNASDLINRTEFGFTAPITGIQGDIRRLYAQDSAFLPVRELTESSFFGFVDSPTTDGVKRRLPLVIRIGEDVYPSLVTQTLLQFWKIGPDDVELVLGEHLIFRTPDGEVKVPVGYRGELALNWRNRDRFFTPSYSFLSGVLGDHVKKGEPWPGDFPTPEGKILLIGQSAYGLTDLGPSPLDSLSPNVLVHATALTNILEGDYLRAPPLALVILLWWAAATATLFVLRSAHIALAAAIPLVLAGLYVGLAYAQFRAGSLLLPIAWPVSAFIVVHIGEGILRWWADQAARREIRSVFSDYVPAQVMEQLLRNPENVKLGGQRRSVAILFSDIRGFTTISESMSEEELVTQLNEYFEKMVDCVHRHEGTLHKYIGDAVMAVWGDVTNQSGPAASRNAVRAALDMGRELRTLNARWEREGRPLFRIGVGINFGEVMVGNIGAQRRKEFTVIGDVVNTSSRLEGLTKEFGVDLVVAESVCSLLGEGFLARTVGVIVVKGKSEALRVYEILREGPQSHNGYSPSWIKSYEEAFELYLQRRFEDAGDLFAACVEEIETDYCARIYRDSARKLKAHPPPSDWRGHLVMTSK